MTDWNSLTSLEQHWQDNAEYQSALLENFRTKLIQDPSLYSHRQWVTANNWGYGVDELHWMWKLISDSFEPNAKFLEIGVFKGQTISLMSFLNDHNTKNTQIIGLGPLDSSGDNVSQHPNIDYWAAIKHIYLRFCSQTQWNNLKIIRGYSNDTLIKSMAGSIAPYDCIFVDGCHDYDVVVDDINTYKEMVKVNGLIVVDDCNYGSNFPLNVWGGFPEVTQAIQEHLDTDSRFKTVAKVAHDKIWRRIA